MALEASIRNREATLCRTWVKMKHPDVFAIFKAQAKEDYSGQRFRRTTERDVAAALQNQIEVKVGNAPDDNPWNDPR